MAVQRSGSRGQVLVADIYQLHRQYNGDDAGIFTGVVTTAYLGSHGLWKRMMAAFRSILFFKSMYFYLFLNNLQGI